MKRLIHVSAGLDPELGGVAKAGRLLAQVEQEYARQRHLEFKLLSLAGTMRALGDAPIEQFNGRQTALMLKVWRYAFTPPSSVFVFDHMGPARACGVLPVRVPYTIFLHGVEVWRPLQKQRIRTLLRAHSLMINSQYSADRAIRVHQWLPMPYVLHLPLDAEGDAGEIDADLLARVGRDFILIVGRLDALQRHKGHDDLLHALPQVIKEIPAARLVIAGAGDDRSRLEQVASAEGVADHVIFTGFVSSATLTQLYQRCRVFAMPSRDDGYGFVYLEAMQAHKPCIGLTSSSAAEIIRHEETGLLVDVGDSGGLENALARLLKDSALAQRLGDAGYARLQNEFTFNRFQKCVFERLDAIFSPS